VSVVISATLILGGVSLKARKTLAPGAAALITARLLAIGAPLSYTPGDQSDDAAGSGPHACTHPSEPVRYAHAV